MIPNGQWICKLIATPAEEIIDDFSIMEPGQAVIMGRGANFFFFFNNVGFMIN